MKNLKRQNHSENLITAPNKSASRIELSRTDVKVLAPSRLGLGGGSVESEGWDASPAPSLQKNFRSSIRLKRMRLLSIDAKIYSCAQSQDLPV